MRNIPVATIQTELTEYCPGRGICDTVCESHRNGMDADAGSRDFMDGNDGVCRIPFDGPGLAHIQQPLNYGRITRSFDRVSPCRHVHSSGEAPTKAGFHYIFHCRHPALGIPRRPPSTRTRKLIRTGQFKGQKLPSSRVHETAYRSPRPPMSRQCQEPTAATQAMILN